MNPHRDPLNDENAISQPKCGTRVLHPVCNIHLSPVKTGQRHALEVQVDLRSVSQGSPCDRNNPPPPPGSTLHPSDLVNCPSAHLSEPQLPYL